MRTSLLAVVACSALVAAPTGVAHSHYAEPAHGGEGQVLDNGQNHPAFVNGESCDTNAHLAGYGPAWYGLETAHHGADAGTPGKGDGCYQTEGRLSPLNPASDQNPAIR